MIFYEYILVAFFCYLYIQNAFRQDIFSLTVSIRSYFNNNLITSTSSLSGWNHLRCHMINNGSTM